MRFLVNLFNQMRFMVILNLYYLPNFIHFKFISILIIILIKFFSAIILIKFFTALVIMKIITAIIIKIIIFIIIKFVIIQMLINYSFNLFFTSQY